MLRTLRQMKTSLKNWFQTFSLLFHVIQLLKSREIIKLELRRAERGQRPSTETVTFIAFVVTFFKSTKLLFVSWAKLVFMMHVQSFFLLTETPFYTGLDKFLNGQKLTLICLTFTRDLRDLAMSFWTASSTAICSRICMVPCKRFAWEKNCPLKHFTGAV